MLALAGCNGLLNDDQLPTNVTDPALTQTPQGALQVYRGVIVQFQDAFGGGDANGIMESAIAVAGQLTDELQGGLDDVIDRRAVPDAGTDPWTPTLYGKLQKVRGQAGQAVGLLQDYLPDSTALRGHAYVLEGYAEIFLAELFCSGIPLSTLDYHGDYTLQPGSSTDSVLKHAVALFDSTLKYAGDNAAVMDLARLGKARALLDVGDYTQAAAVASTVADAYLYQAHYTARYSANTLFNFTGADWVGNGPSGLPEVILSVADHEGLHGLNYVSSGDPRTAVQNVNGSNMPVKYAPFDGSSPIVLASGIEARLIEAEAALRQDPNGTAWLDKLNALRTDGTNNGVTTFPTVADTLGVTGCNGSSICGGNGPDGSTPEFGRPVGGFPMPSGYTLTDSVQLTGVNTITLSNGQTISDYCFNYSWYAPCYNDYMTWIYHYNRPDQVAWNPGTGGYPGLGPLSDPGTDSARVDLLFRERAFWLFLTGHREGDLRRLIRQYGRQPDQVYPSGSYFEGGNYGTTIMLPVPAQERASNPLFTGCGA